jgi:uncharacterized protein YjbI with pentapeptide repeats
MMDANELKEVLRKHELWLNEEAPSWADLTGADLTGANLRGAVLTLANLTGANLRGADLTGANLREAILRRADLREADLTGADLREADLTGADLRRADLHWADLRGASGAFVTGYYGKHHAIAAGGYISIGCMRHTYDVWLDNGEQIGKDNNYTDAEIADYMDWIKLAIRALERMERE